MLINDILEDIHKDTEDYSINIPNLYLLMVL